MNQLGTVYATKRRRRNSKSLKPPPKDGITKSNPSKRHRERLNAELDTLASLLPFEASILSKLDKLSILRLSVSYLRTKSYFQVAMYGIKDSSRIDTSVRNHDTPCLDNILDSDLILQALNGFLLILASEGEVFFASHTIESYLGFHQSDIVHQSVYELVHSEDREELQRQLMWNSFLPPDGANMTLQQVLQLENCQYLERSFTVRFRCLLDNTSGFLRLDIRGRIKVLHGQNRKTEEPPLALFAVCTPFGPPSLLEVPQKDVMFKSKHKLDMSLVSMDQRGKMLLGYSDSELSNKGGYDLVHFDDLAYVANAHQELLKTGASGMIAYRVITKDSQWQWLQTSSRLVYKCSKPDFIICTHRPLMEEEGRDLLGKRTMDFKVSYLDATLSSSSYPTDGDYSSVSSSGRSQKGRRYKNQLRDILTTCRKRKVHGNEYTEEPSYNGVYPYPAENGIGPYVQSNLQNLYPALDNSRFFSAEDFLQYRHLSNYYTDYPHPAAAAPPYGMGNGFLDMPPGVATRSCLPPPPYADSSPLAKEEKLYPCQLESAKFNNNNGADVRLFGVAKQPSCCDGYGADLNRGCIVGANMAGMGHQLSALAKMHEEASPPPSRSLKNEALHSVHHLHESNCGGAAGKASGVSGYSNDTRQTVLMWGSTGVSCRSVASSASSSTSTSPQLHPYGQGGGGGASAAPDKNHRYDGQMKHGAANEHNLSCKWGGASPPKTTPPHSSSPHVITTRVLTPASYSSSPYAASEMTNELQQQQQQQQQHRGAIIGDKHDVSPLLSISEVTNALLSHD